MRNVGLPYQRESRWLTPFALVVAVVLHIVAISILAREIHYTSPVAEDVRILLLPLGASEPETPRLSEVTEIPSGVDQPTAAVAPAPALPLPIAARRSTALQVPQPVAESRTGVYAERPDTVGAVAGGGSSADPGSLLDRIRPRGTDPRLRVPTPPIRVEETKADPFTSALAPLYAQFDAYNDSARAAAEAAARATDWTATDENGNRWGISPSGIHLGKITIPIPIGFSPPPGRRDELSGRVSGWSAIRRQSGETEARESFEDRVKAIRERNAAKRDTSRTRKN
jgi:hypothetical protein